MAIKVNGYQTYKRICPGCGQGIEDDEMLVGATNHGNRTWHDECWNNRHKKAEQEDKEKKLREDILITARKYLGSSANEKLINQQMDRYKSEGKKYQGIKLTLDYWYGTQGGTPGKANGGIGIVDFIYNEAAQKYKEKLDREKAQRLQLADQGKHDNFLNMERKVPTKIQQPRLPVNEEHFHLD